jgi:SAM-dependent methyltransferase
MAESVLNNRPLRIGYVSSNHAVVIPILKQVVERYISKPASVRFVEPGCGLAHISRIIAKTHDWKEVVALDIRHTLVFLARICNLFSKAPVTYHRLNVFDYDYEMGDCIYCYLSTQILDKLYKEGKFSGKLVVCLSFAISDAKPTETIPVSNWQKQVYVYDFRSNPPQI